MFTFADADRKAQSERVAGLEVGAFSTQDVLNLILQRSEIIQDQPNHNRYIKDWINGRNEPILELIQKVGSETLIRRAAAFILLEYEELAPVIAQGRPRAVTDIGCGYAIFDLFLGQDHDCHITLIDLEDSETRHFGFEQTGAAYSNLDVAAGFMAANGVAADRITTINPLREPVDQIRDQDMAFSFISCGFHYPWTTYETFFRDAVVPGGRIILDIRSRTLRGVRAELETLGAVSILEVGLSPKVARVLVTKPPKD